MDPDFCSQIDQNELLVEILRTAKKDTYINSKQLLQQAYEQSSGLFDYLGQARKELNVTTPDAKRPLASVAANKGEDTFAYSRMFDTIKAYADSNVKEYYGMSLQEFLQYPRVVCVFILEDSQRRLKTKVSEDSKVIQGIQDLQKQTK